MKHICPILLLIAGLSLLPTGCAKKLDTGVSQRVTFTAEMANEVTKAAIDGDGAAANVNRCIMEIYYGEALFSRQYSAVNDKKATFTAELIANRTYTVAFWADCTEALEADKYYNTTSLKNVSLKTPYAGNKDARDAFHYSTQYTVNQGGSSFGATLTRPFAQINVITTDLQIIKPVPDLQPDGVDLVIKGAYTTINVISGEVSGEQNLSYTASLYNFPETIGDKSEATLSMDYLFASATKDVVDIDWKATKSGSNDVVHAFSNIPYQRNYRTNIKGALLTTVGQWNVTVDPLWISSDVATIGTTGYETVAAAFEAVQENETVKMLANVSTDAQITVNKACTLDLNGKTITSNVTSDAFVLNDKLTVTDSSDGHDGKFTTSTNPYIFRIGSGSVTISGGTFTNTGDGGIFCGDYGTTWTITGGSFSCGSGRLIDSYGAVFNISGNPTFTAASEQILYCNTPAPSKKITISGGTFTNTGNGGKVFPVEPEQPILISGGTFTENPSSIIVSGYKSVSDGGTPETWTITQ